MTWDSYKNCYQKNIHLQIIYILYIYMYKKGLALNNL